MFFLPSRRPTVQHNTAKRDMTSTKIHVGGQGTRVRSRNSLTPELNNIQSTLRTDVIDQGRNQVFAVR